MPSTGQEGGFEYRPVFEADLTYANIVKSLISASDFLEIPLYPVFPLHWARQMASLHFLEDPQNLSPPVPCTIWPRVPPSVRGFPQMVLGNEFTWNVDTSLRNIDSPRGKVILFSSLFIHFWLHWKDNLVPDKHFLKTCWVPLLKMIYWGIIGMQL